MTNSEPPSEFARLLRTEAAELACGASVDELIEQVADGHSTDLTDHQRDCQHCQAGLQEFNELWNPVREYANRPVLVPQRIVAAVMARVDKLVADVWYTLQLTDGGAIKIAARVVASVARDTARRVPGVRVAFGRSSDTKVSRLVEKATLAHRHPHAAVGVLGRTAVVELALAVTYGDPVHDIAREVQRRVVAELTEKIGLKSVVVNITVDDVLLPRSDHIPNQ